MLARIGGVQRVLERRPLCVDDLLLLSEASSEQAAIINNIMNEFCVSSGANVNK